MKMRRDKKRGSLLLAILLSGIFFTVVSIIGRMSVYQEYPINLWKEPVLTVMFEAAADGIYPWKAINTAACGRKVEATSIEEGSQDWENQDVAQGDGDQTDTDRNDAVRTDEDQEAAGRDDTEADQEAADSTKKEQAEEKQEPSDDDDAEQTEESQEPADQDDMDQKDAGQNENEASEHKENESGDMQPVKDKDKQEHKKVNKEESKSELAFGPVDTDYFDDALFIGDSRTVGLSEYSYLTNATFYSDVGLSVYSVFDKKFAKVGKKTVTLEKALEKKKFKKIYIMLGINELGTGNAKTFVSKYEEMLDKIHEMQPDAYLIVQAIMNIAKKRSDSDAIFNNKNITARNKGLAKLADGKSVFFLDVNQVLTDEDGYLPEAHTFDSVHLLAKYYNEWADFLSENGIIEH